MEQTTNVMNTAGTSTKRSKKRSGSSRLPKGQSENADRPRSRRGKSTRKTISETSAEDSEQIQACCKQITESFWTQAWSICSERFYNANAESIVAHEIRDSYLKIVEQQFLDEKMMATRRLESQRNSVQNKPDEPPLPLALDSWSRGAIESFPKNRRESVLDPFLRDNVGLSDSMLEFFINDMQHLQQEDGRGDELSKTSDTNITLESEKEEILAELPERGEGESKHQLDESLGNVEYNTEEENDDVSRKESEELVTLVEPSIYFPKHTSMDEGHVNEDQQPLTHNNDVHDTIERKMPLMNLTEDDEDEDRE